MTKHKRTPRRRLTAAATKRFREKLGIEELLLQPWFLPKKIALGITKLVPPDYRKRMRDCFIDFGCLRCGHTDRIYGANGMCAPCQSVTYARVVASGNKRLRGRQPLRYGKEFVGHADRARKLLKDYRRRGLKPPSNVKSVQLLSPAINVFDRYEF
jgi:hypothetical protein